MKNECLDSCGRSGWGPKAVFVTGSLSPTMSGNDLVCMYPSPEVVILTVMG